MFLTNLFLFSNAFDCNQEGLVSQKVENFQEEMQVLRLKIFHGAVTHRA